MMRRLVLVPVLLVLALPAVAAKKPKPPPCEPGTFAMTSQGESLIPDADPAEERILIETGGMTELPSGCPAVQGKLKTGRKGTKISAKWGKATCTGLPKKVKLKAKFDASCQLLEGKLKSKKHKRRFSAVRLPEGFGAPALAPELEENASLARTVGPEGGEITTFGADGARYRLRVPPGALGAPTAITITPATAVGGLPLEGGLLQAVAFGPAGLRFEPSATLTITPAAPLPAQLAGFGWSGDDDAMGIAPWWLDGDGNVHLRVDHFSGYGIGIPGPSQLDTLAAEIVALEGARAALLAPTCLETDAVCTQEDYEQLVDDWYTQLVDPRLSDGNTGPVEALEGHEALMMWMSALLALGVDHDLEPVAIGQNLLNLIDVFEKYTPPSCSGTVSDWRDFVRIPQELSQRARGSYHYSEAQLAPLEFNLLAGCAELVLADVSFPDTLGDQQTELPLSFQSVVRVPGTSDVGVETEVDLFFGPGASGQGQLLTETNGQLETEVSREPTAPRVAVDVVAKEPATGLPAYAHLVVGNTDFVFEDNRTGAPPKIVPTGDTKELCVFSQVGAPAGTGVDFSLVDPGQLQSSSAPLADQNGELAACVTYQAPDGPVGRNLAAVATATMSFDGETYTDTVQVYPHWKDILLEADVGNGYVNATNTTLGITGDGPYNVRASVLEAGEDVTSEPVPVANQPVDVEADEQTLVDAQGCCTDVAGPTTNAQGVAYVQWRANGSASDEFPIEFFAGTDASLVTASLILERDAWELDVSYPSVVEAGVPETLTVTVTQGGATVESAWIEIDVTGGDTAGTSGTTDANGELETQIALAPGQTQLTILLRASASPGGAVLATETVTASSDALPATSFWVGTEEFLGNITPAELVMTLDPATGDVGLRTCESYGFGGPGSSCMDNYCDALWIGTLVGDQLTAEMVNHTSPCAIGDPGQNRLYGCQITATLSTDGNGKRRLTGSGDGSFFSCFGSNPEPLNFEVCEGGCD